MIHAQRTIGWHRDRLGKFTGSEVGKLMVSGRKKGETFGDTAKTYIMNVLKQRLLDTRMVEDDMLFEEYLSRHSIDSYATRWGTDNEPFAREAYEKQTGNHVVEVGSIPLQGVPTFASSPDGYFYDEGTGEKGCIEIKCPYGDGSSMKLMGVHDTDSLKEANSVYWWQCMSHMLVLDAQWCDFVVYDPELKDGLKVKVTRIMRDDAAIEELVARLSLAEEYIDNWMEENL